MTLKNASTVQGEKYASKSILVDENDQQERDTLAKLFLDLYQLQIKGFEPSEKKMTPIDPPGTGIFSYELRVKQYDKWCIRTFAVEKLGEGEGPRSKCYKVFYDNVLVVKIPRHPITEYDAYVEQLNAERSIAKQLKPEIPSIVPGISSIMRRIPLFLEKMELLSNDKNYLNSDAFEERCIHRLKVLSSFQKYLKLDGTFVFFMDISKYQFLHDVISALHNVDEMVEDEIFKRRDLVCEFQKFEEKFGVDRIPVWLQINDAFKFYEKQLEKVIERHNLKDTFQSYETASWFFYFLSGKAQQLTDKIAGAHEDPGRLVQLEAFRSEVFSLLKEIEINRRPDIDAYHNAVRDFAEETWFSQSIRRMSELVSGLIRLLALLRKKGIAFRDLKPTNILLAEEKPLSALEHGKTVSLGLIDFENTVSLNKYRGRFIEQPLLGGTLSYATPSNFADNSLLEATYPDLSRTLHLQDWQACISMIFLIVVGERLFENTRLILYETLRMMKNTFFFGVSTEQSFENFNRLFWETADVEFQRKVKTHRHRLESIDVSIPAVARKMLAQEVMQEKKRLTEEIHHLVNHQHVLKQEAILSGLVKMSADSVGKWVMNLEQQDSRNSNPANTRKWLGSFLSKLVSLKRKQEQCDEFYTVITKHWKDATVDLLIRFMFSTVMTAMFSQKWGK